MRKIRLKEQKTFGTVTSLFKKFQITEPGYEQRILINTTVAHFETVGLIVLECRFLRSARTNQQSCDTQVISYPLAQNL